MRIPQTDAEFQEILNEAVKQSDAQQLAGTLELMGSKNKLSLVDADVLKPAYFKMLSVEEVVESSKQKEEFKKAFDCLGMLCKVYDDNRKQHKDVAKVPFDNLALGVAELHSRKNSDSYDNFRNNVIISRAGAQLKQDGVEKKDIGEFVEYLAKNSPQLKDLRTEYNAYKDKYKKDQKTSRVEATLGNLDKEKAIYLISFEILKRSGMQPEKIQQFLLSKLEDKKITMARSAIKKEAVSLLATYGVIAQEEGKETFDTGRFRKCFTNRVFNDDLNHVVGNIRGQAALKKKGGELIESDFSSLPDNKKESLLNSTAGIESAGDDEDGKKKRKEWDGLLIDSLSYYNDKESKLRGFRKFITGKFAQESSMMDLLTDGFISSVALGPVGLLLYSSEIKEKIEPVGKVWNWVKSKLGMHAERSYGDNLSHEINVDHMVDALKSRKEQGDQDVNQQPKSVQDVANKLEVDKVIARLDLAVSGVKGLPKPEKKPVLGPSGSRDV